jgi:hypothetical protein
MGSVRYTPGAGYIPGAGFIPGGIEPKHFSSPLVMTVGEKLVSVLSSVAVLVSITTSSVVCEAGRRTLTLLQETVWAGVTCTSSNPVP